MNWRGRPLTSHEVIVAAIASTTTRAGLAVRAELDTGTYPSGVQISDEQMAALPLRAPRLARRLELHPVSRAARPVRGAGAPAWPR